MNCNEARDLLSAKLDGELSPEELANLEVHLASCKECQSIYEAYCALDADLAELAEPPATLRESVMETIRREKVVTFPKKRWMFGSGTAIAAVAAMLVLVIGGYIPGFSSDSATTTGAPALETATVTTSTTTAVMDSAMLREAVPEMVFEESIDESIPESAPTQAVAESAMDTAAVMEVEIPMLTLELPADQVPELADFQVEQDGYGTYFCRVPGDVIEALCTNPDYGLELPVGYLDAEALYRVDCANQ